MKWCKWCKLRRSRQAKRQPPPCTTFRTPQQLVHHAACGTPPLTRRSAFPTPTLPVSSHQTHPHTPCPIAPSRIVCVYSVCIVYSYKTARRTRHFSTSLPSGGACRCRSPHRSHCCCCSPRSYCHSHWQHPLSWRSFAFDSHQSPSGILQQ